MRTRRGINATTPSKHQHDGSSDKKPHAWLMREQRQHHEDGDADQQQPDSDCRLEHLAPNLVHELLNNGISTWGARGHVRADAADRHAIPQIKRLRCCTTHAKIVCIACRRTLFVRIGLLLHSRQCPSGIVRRQRPFEEVGQLRRQSGDLALG